jgi:hypothetical protein
MKGKRMGKDKLNQNSEGINWDDANIAERIYREVNLYGER